MNSDLLIRFLDASPTVVLGALMVTALIVGVIVFQLDREQWETEIA